MKRGQGTHVNVKRGKGLKRKYEEGAGDSYVNVKRGQGTQM